MLTPPIAVKALIETTGLDHCRNECSSHNGNSARLNETF
jgi:hypothetical protein